MRIVTHNGKIHSDEVSAVALLSSYFSNKGIEVSVLRTRNSDKFLETDCLVDVGGEYDNTRYRYDHHQSDFNEIWPGFNIPLSSAGLIWKHYGKEIVEMYLSNNAEQYDHGFNYSETTIEELVNMIYEKLIYDIDANDNGISLLQNNLNISDIVSAVNGNVNDDEIQNINFNRAVSLVGNIFDIKFREIINSYFNFQKDLETVSSLDLSKEYLILTNNIPTIFKCLAQLDPQNIVKFCIFLTNENEYTIKARRTNGQKYSPICPILSEEILQYDIPSEEIIFVHKASFIAKTSTLSAAEKIVQLSLEFLRNENIESEEIEEINIVENIIENSVENIENIEYLKKIDLSLVKDKRLVVGLALGGGIATLSYLYFRKND
jgi:uncharacterized UPF0160 family protein